MKSGHRIQLGQVVNEERLNDNGSDDEVAVDDNPEVEEQVVEYHEDII